MSLVSKVFEKLLCVCLEKFFTEHNIITKQQFGFRPGYSTKMAITNLNERLKKNLDEGGFTCCVFLDLSKAFDIVNHKMLLKKLQFNDIRGNMFSLLNNYLSNRA